jgi:hypothetical protein
MPPTGGDDGDGTPDDRRRRVLAYAALAALGASGVAGAWTLSRPESSDPAPTPTRTPESTATATATTTAGDPTDSSEAVPELVARYAPDLYFGALEKWYPTDPRRYVVETDDGPVVDGFAALDGYSAAFEETGEPPAPTAFYSVVEAADGVDAVQYWFYSVFDQFTVNFHWHDWELLQVFVDRESGSPLLLSASAHSRSVPNNEFLAPDAAAGWRPGLLSEVGSHSSASEVNGVVPTFERLPTGEWAPDVTNDVLESAPGVAAPFAYGLPRDEGARLPFAMPELDGHRLDRHPALSVGREAFVDERATVDSWHGLPRPPADLPLREPGLVFASAGSPTAADATYVLEPLARVRDAVSDFVGPQLSFEFAVPGFVENRLAGHITSVGIPWEQARFTDPLADVTDPVHRERIDGARPSGLSDRVVGRVRRLGGGADGALGGVSEAARPALEGAATVSLYPLPVEVAVRLSSASPVATVTRRGAFGYLHVDRGDHLLVVDGPGFAPLGQRFVHGGGSVRVGADGELAVVTTEDAGWIRGDGRGTNGVSRVRVTEDYAGVVYDGRPVETDRFAVAVHRDGRYTVEVVDADGRHGAYRVGPGSFEDGEARREAVETGKASLAGALRDEVGALRDLADRLAERDRNESVVPDRLSRAREHAAAAAGAATDGDGRAADERLADAAAALEGALERLLDETRRTYDDAAVAALEPRIRAALDRAASARRTELA